MCKEGERFVRVMGRKGLKKGDGRRLISLFPFDPLFYFLFFFLPSVYVVASHVFLALHRALLALATDIFFACRPASSRHVLKNDDCMGSVSALGRCFSFYVKRPLLIGKMNTDDSNVSLFVLKYIIVFRRSVCVFLPFSH